MKATKRFLSIALVFLMLFAAALPGACAGQTKTYTELKPTEALTINETLKLEKNDTPVPTVTYTFTVTGGPTLMEGESLGGAVGNPFFSTDTVAFSQSDAGDVTVVGAGDYSRQITKQVVMDFTGVTFTEPGIYRWQITKTRTAAPATGQALPSNNKQVTYVYVTVIDDTAGGTPGSELKLKDVSYIYTTSDTLPEATGPAAGGARNFILSGDKAYPRTGLTKIDSIEDLYPTRTHDLSFGKKVTGNQGSKDKYFMFTLTLQGLEQGVSYPVTGQDTDPQKTDSTTYDAVAMKTANNREVITANAAGKVVQDFYLQHGDYITVENLPVGAHYTLTEVNEDYTKTNGTDDKVTQVNLKNYAAQYQAAAEDLEGKITSLTQEKSQEQTAKDVKNQQKTEAQNDLRILNESVQGKETAIQTADLAGAISILQALIQDKEKTIEYQDSLIDAKLKEIYGDGDPTSGALNELNNLLQNTPQKDEYNQALSARNSAQQAVWEKQNAHNEAQREKDKKDRLLSEAQAAKAAAEADKAAKQEAYDRANQAKEAAAAEVQRAEAALQAAQDAPAGTYTPEQLAALAAALDAAEALLGDETRGAIKALNDAEAALTAAVDALGDDTKGAIKALNDANQALNDAVQALSAAKTAEVEANDTLVEKQEALNDAADLFNSDTQISDKMNQLEELYNQLRTLNDGKITLLNDLGSLKDQKALNEQTLQDDLNALQVLKDQVAAKNAEIAEMEAAMTGLQQEIDDLTAEIAALQAERDKLIDRKAGLADRTFTDAQDGYIKDDDVFTGFTNNRENVVPTGILSQLGAPVALILASLALMVLLTLGRKKQARG